MKKRNFDDGLPYELRAALLEISKTGASKTDLVDDARRAKTYMYGAHTKKNVTNFSQVNR